MHPDCVVKVNNRYSGLVRRTFGGVGKRMERVVEEDPLLCRSPMGSIFGFNSS